MADSRYYPRPGLIFNIDTAWKFHKLPKDDIAIPLKQVPELNEDGESYSDNPGQLIRHQRLTVQQRRDLHTSIDLEHFGIHIDQNDEAH